jgi:hypothetical protein
MTVISPGERITMPHPRAQFVLFDGFDPLDAVAPYEVLSAGRGFGPGIAHAVEELFEYERRGTIDTDVVHTTTAHGERVTWRQRITRPMRLNLAYDVTVTGDTLAGHSRVGRLPRTAVTGERAGA